MIQVMIVLKELCGIYQKMVNKMDEQGKRLLEIANKDKEYYEKVNLVDEIQDCKKSVIKVMDMMLKLQKEFIKLKRDIYEIKKYRK